MDAEIRVEPYPVANHFFNSKEKVETFIWKLKHTIAETSPSACKCSTILLLCVGSTLANNLALMHAALCSSEDKSSNSRPV